MISVDRQKLQMQAKPGVAPDTI